MSARILAASALALTGCFGHASPPGQGGPPHRDLPVLDLSEDQDEALHARCRYGALETAPLGARVVSTASPDANIAELIYQSASESYVATFSCSERPEWFSGVWMGPTARAMGAEPGY